MTLALAHAASAPVGRPLSTTSLVSSGKTDRSAKASLKCATKRSRHPALYSYLGRAETISIRLDDGTDLGRADAPGDQPVIGGDCIQVDAQSASACASDTHVLDPRRCIRSASLLRKYRSNV